MDEVEKKREEALALLETIQSLDDLKKNKDGIIECIVSIFETGVAKLDEFVKEKDSLPPEEKSRKMSLFMDEGYLMDPRIEQEMIRMDSIPGVVEYFETLQEELNGRVESHLEKYGELMGGLMDEMMGGMMENVMGGLGEAMGQAMAGMGEMMGGMADAFSQENQGTTVDDDPNRERVNALCFIYDAMSIKDLLENKDYLFESVSEKLTSDLEELKTIKEMEIPYEDVADRVDSIERDKVFMQEEVELELKRFMNTPGGAEHVVMLKSELRGMMLPVHQEMEDLVEGIRKP